MRNRVVVSLLTLMIALGFFASDSAAQAKGPKPKSDGLLLPITGKTSTGGTLDGGRFDGKFALERFASDGRGGIVAVGVISGTVMAADGNVVGTVFRGPVSLPVADPRPARTGFVPAPSSTGPVWDHETPPPAP